jgi:DNA-binding response OmpR family regulator
VADILLIDDMNLVRGAIKAILTRAGHRVTEARNGETGLELLRTQRFDLLITDVLMPGTDGNDIIMHLQAMPDRPPILSISGGGSGISAEQALLLSREKADAAMTKPFVNHELLAAVDALVGSRPRIEAAE